MQALLSAIPPAQAGTPRRAAPAPPIFVL